jgi:tripartite-type tricarboxylate transporter receptor subunit TctC
MKNTLHALFSVALLAISATSTAQSNFPDKPIRLVIGSAAGSGPDIISRVLAERLFKDWNQRILIDTRPGAAGIISAELAGRAAPDGYTWMMLTSQLLVATAVLPTARVNLDRDFASIGLVGTVPFVLVANPQVSAQSVSELIAMAKQKPGSLKYGSAGNGSSEHLSGVMLTSLTGTDMLHVPYKGVAQALTDAASREVDLAYGVLPAVAPLIKSGRLKAIGVTSRRRAGLLPDVPSIADAVPGYEMLGWYSLVAPTGTPAAILEKISADVARVTKEPEFAEQLKGLGIDPVGGTRAELDAFRASQTKRITELAKSAGPEINK